MQGVEDDVRPRGDQLSGEVAAGVGADRFSEAGWRPQVWQALASELGVLGAALPEEMGGLGGGPVDTMVVMQALGAALVVEPYLETVVIGASLLKRIPGQEAAVGRIIEGEMITAFAWSEPQGRFDPADVATTAKRDGAGWRLDGVKAVVEAAPWASHLIVTACTSGERREAEGVSLFLVPADHAGLSLRDYATVDGRRAAEVTLDGCRWGLRRCSAKRAQPCRGWSRCWTRRGRRCARRRWAC